MSDNDSNDITRTYIQLAGGTVIGHYRIIEKIGAGGMGEVYLAEDTELNRKVALKFLPPHLCQDADCRARFKREAQAAAKLNHPNIVTIHEVGEFNGRPFIVTEYAGGRTLTDIIDSKRVTPSEAVNIIVQVCEGLQEAHSAGIVHRDIKPSNVVLETSGHPKIVDFGLAAVQGAKRVTRTGSAMGTVGYMSPEQLKGAAVDHRTDLFSVGVVLYELITGKNPFTADNEAAVQNSILFDTPEPLARFKSGIPEGLQEVVDRALEKDAHVRYQSAADMVADLRRLRRRSSDSVGARRPGKWFSPVGWFKYRYVTISVIIVVVAAVFWELYRTGSPNAFAVQKHLAVVPFINLGGASLSQTMCDGLVETITSKLTQLAEFDGSLRVVPSSEVRERKVSSAGQARRVFGIDLAVTGSIQQYGDGFRLTLNLVDAATQRQLRSAVVDETMSDMSLLQDSIVTELAQMLDVQLRPDTRRLMTVGRTSSSSAYYSYLRGRGYLQRYESAECLDSAESLFSAAIDQDSSFALAYAGLGEVYWQKYNLSMDIRWVAPAIAKSVRALEMNDQLAPVLVTLGLIHRGTGQYEEAIRYLRQALKIDSLNNEAYIELASAYESLGLEKEAESTYLTAVRLRPDYWLNYYHLAFFRLNQGKRDEALKQTAIAESLAPIASYPYAFLGGLYIYLGETEKAKELLSRSIDLEPNYGAYSNLGAIYQTEKKYENAAQMYEHALKIRSSDYRVWINLASIYDAMPDTREKSKAAYDSAIVLAEQNLAVNPNSALTRCYLADCYAATGRRDKSLELARQAVRLSAGNPEVLVRAGIVFEGAGKRDDALDAIGRAIERGFPVSELQKLNELHGLVADSRFDSITTIKK